MWPEVSIVLKEKRHELLLSGETLENNLKEKDGILDEEIWKLNDINFLSLTNSSLSNISDNMGNLNNLTNLVLQGNQLCTLPESIGNLTKLKFLNVSENKLISLPSSICELSTLSTLNAKNNEIASLPKFTGCSSLAHVDFTHNVISSFEELCNVCLILLADINLSHNEIIEVPTEVKDLTSIKQIDLSNNMIKEVPCEFAQCPKLKEINLKNNKLIDFKLRKIVESDRSLPKHVIDYLKQYQKQNKGKKKKNSSPQKESNNEEVNEMEILVNRLSILSCKNNVTVTATNDILTIRGYIVCCILRDLDLTGVNLKKFINIQTKLHDGACQRRVAATIATHDLNKVLGPLQYTCKPAKEIVLHPLNAKKETDAISYYRRLSKEAENMRRQNKRNNVSGLYKYLHLVESMPAWPCLTDVNGKVISMPPLTNSDCTKIENDTTDVLIEVTSGVSLKKAKDVMDALVVATLEDGLGLKEEKYFSLTVEQVKVVGADGALRVVYPSRTDLNLDDNQVKVIRE